MTEQQLVISIINYRTAPETLACVQSVLADLGDCDARVVVVDNASGDGSADKIESWIAAQVPPVPVDLIRSPVNSGFSGGHNQSFAHLEAAHYLLLNSDAIVQPGALARMLQAARTDPRVGLVSPGIRNTDGTPATSCFRFHSPASEFIRGACSGPVTRLLKNYDVSIPAGASAAPDWVSFACVLLNGRMVREIGPMDEGYFLYFEDSAYCLQARRAGWHIRCAPEAEVLHEGGGSGPVVSLTKAKRRLPTYVYASRTRFLFQSYGYVGLWAANLAWIAGRGVSALRWLAGKRPYPAQAWEMVDMWCNIFNPAGPSHAPGARE